MKYINIIYMTSKSVRIIPSKSSHKRENEDPIIIKINRTPNYTYRRSPPTGYLRYGHSNTVRNQYKPKGTFTAPRTYPRGGKTKKRKIKSRK